MKTIDFIRFRKVALTLSVLTISLLWAYVHSQGGIIYGIDFTGGIRHIFKFDRPSDPALLSQVRAAVINVDAAAQVQNIGELEDGEVVVQVKGFDLVQRLLAHSAALSDPLTIERVKEHFQGEEIINNDFYRKLIRGDITRQRLEKTISDHVNHTTAARLKVELSKTFGSSSKGQFDLNGMSGVTSLSEIFRGMYVSRFASMLVTKAATSNVISDFDTMLIAEGLDPEPFSDNFLLREPTLEELKINLLKFASRPFELEAVLKNIYPEPFKGRFDSIARKIVEERESKGLYKDTEDAIALVDDPFIKDMLKSNFYTGPFILIKTDQVSSRIGAELREKALTVILWALMGMLVYITLRFDFRFAVGAVIALFHDAMITIAAMAALKYEYDISMIAAILTIIGYSLNDTIVIYDRIRENLINKRGLPLNEIINISVTMTLSRTVITAITTLLAASSLFYFGGPVTEGFSVALLIGVSIGTYSSIFVASAVVYAWPAKNIKK